MSLPYRLFDSAQQRVTHAAVTENKRLREVLAHVMTQQDTAPPKADPVGKRRSRYALTGNPYRGRKGWVEKRAERHAAENLAMPSAPAE